jgi:DNA-binding transcriptional MerR regulator
VAKKLFYKIGEACKQLDIQPYVLRYWETEFAALSPSKSRSGQRVYGEDDLRLIRRIKELLYEEGFTIAGAKKRLEAEVAAGGPRPRALHAVPVHGPEPPEAAAAGTGERPKASAAVDRAGASAAPPQAGTDAGLRQGLAAALRQAREILALLGPSSSHR